MRNQKTYQSFLGREARLLGGADQSSSSAFKIREVSNQRENMPQEQQIVEEKKDESVQQNMVIINFEIEKDNQEIKIVFDGQPTEFTTKPAQIVQTYRQQWKNLKNCEKYNGVSMRFVNPNQLLNLAEKPASKNKKKRQKKKKQNKQQLQNLITSLQIVGNQSTLQQLAVGQGGQPIEVKNEKGPKVLPDVNSQRMQNEASYARSKKYLGSAIKFFKNDIVLLEDVCRGGQAQVRVGFNQRTKQMLVMKHFLTDEANFDYQRERDMYKYLKKIDCGDLVLNLLEHDDQNKILVIERGICDLQNFAELRRKADNPDGPLTAAEILFVMEYVASAMQRLWEMGRVCLCDTKEQNILLHFSTQELVGYKPILTDLGAAYCKKVDRKATYPVALTAKYFDPEVLDSLEYENFVQNEQEPMQRPIDEEEEDEELIIQSEIYTLGRTIQSLLSYCFPENKQEEFKQLRNLFNEHNQVEQYLLLFRQYVSGHQEEQDYFLIADLLGQVLCDKIFVDYETLILEIQESRKQILFTSEQQTKAQEFLIDTSDCARKWQQNLIAQKSDLNSLTIQELQQQAEYYHLHYLFTNCIVIYQKIIELLEVELKQAAQSGQNNSEINIKLLLKSQTLSALGKALKQTGNVEKALECNEEELKIRTVLLREPQNFDLVNCLMEISCNTVSLGKLDKAQEMNQICLNVIKRLFGEYHEFLSNVYMNMSAVYQRQGKFQQAQELSQKCHEIQKKNLGKNSLYLAQAYRSIATLHSHQGRPDLALQMYTQCLNIMKIHYDENDFNLATIYNNIGREYFNQGNLQQALDMFMKCLNIMKAHYGENNFHLSETYTGLGNVFLQQEKLEQAREMFTKSLNILKAHYGENSFHLDTTYNNIGNVYINEKKPEQALEIYSKCLNIQKAYYGENNFNLAITYNNLGNAYLQQKNLDKALELYLKCLDIKKAHYGENNFNLASTLMNIGIVYSEQDKMQKALDFYTKCINIKIVHYGKDSFHLGDSYFNLAQLYLQMIEIEKSLEYSKKAIHIYEKNFGKGYERAEYVKQWQQKVIDELEKK